MVSLIQAYYEFCHVSLFIVSHLEAEIDIAKLKSINLLVVIKSQQN
jgi:hypothetical protein